MHCKEIKKNIQCLNKLFMEFTYVDIVKNVSPKVSIMYIKSSSHSAHSALYDIEWCYGTFITVQIKQNSGLEKMGWIVHGKTELHAPDAHKTLRFPMQNPSISNHLKPPMKMHKSSQTFIVKLQSVPFFVKKNFLVVNIDCVLEMDLTVEHLIQN